MPGIVPRLKRFLNTTWSDVALIFLAGLLPLTWFRGSLISAMDLPWPMLSPQHVAKAALSTWNPGLCLGAQDISYRQSVYLLGNLSLSKLGLSGLTIEKLWFVFWFAGAGLSAYFLIRVLVPRHRIAAVVGGLFYMLNPFAMQVRWYELNLLPFYYALIPLLLAFFVLLIRTGRLRYMAGFLIAAVLLSPSHANLGTLAMVGIVLAGYLIVFLVQNRKAREKIWLALRYTLILAILWAGISMWWILPSAASLREEVSLRQEPGTTVNLVELASQNSTWDKVLRLQGYWGFDEVYGNASDPLFPYAKSYDDSLIAVLGWIIPILALIGVWLARRYKGLVWPAFLWLGSLFFMKGIQPPLGGLTKWMYQSLPGMSVFRNPFDKFGMLAVLGLAPLVGMGLEGSYRFIRGRMKKEWLSKAAAVSALVAVAVILLVVLVWPMWTGDVIYGGGEVMPSFRLRDMPPDYSEASAWLSGQQDDFRVLPIPYNMEFWSLALFDWYQGHDPTRLLLQADTATPSSGFSGRDFAEEAASEVAGGLESARGLCSLLNIKYVLLREDANWKIVGGEIAPQPIGYISASLPALQQTLNAQSWLEPAARFGKLVFYRNRDWQPLSAYAAADSESVDVEANNLAAKADSCQAVGQVDWSEDDSGNIRVTSLSDDGSDWVGIRQRLPLVTPSFPYSYQLKTADTVQVHVKIEWFDEEGHKIGEQLLQMGVDGTTDWTPYSGLLSKPPGGSRAELVIFMRARKEATIEVKDFFVGEQPWIQAFSQENTSANESIGGTARGMNIFVSTEDAAKLGLGENEAPATTVPQCTIEESSPWSARVKLETAGPCFLVLNQAFNAGWRAYLGSPDWTGVLTGAKQLNAEHVMVNGYANGWYIKQPGEYEVTLYYRPQTLLPLGAIISALFWALLVAWYILRRRSVKRRIVMTKEESDEDPADCEAQ
jgi:hypothetical protein